MNSLKRLIRGEIQEDTQLTNTSVYTDSENGVVVDLTFHSYRRGNKGWFTLTMTPIPSAHRSGVHIPTSKALTFGFEELEALIKEAQDKTERFIVFTSTYQKKIQKGKMAVREVEHRLRNARQTTIGWKAQDEAFKKLR